jgi:lycopene beta-cyclase
MIDYDFAILGGGASGLSLALALTQSSLGTGNILLVEKDSKDRNDRTWSYWTSQDSFLDNICYKVWHTLRITSDQVDFKIPFQPYRYQMIRGIDFYHYMHQELRRFPNFKYLNGMVNGWQDGEESAQVWVDGEVIHASWVFDSRLNPADIQPDSSKYHYLKQHFTGWEIETEAPVFDPDVATLFDLRTNQSSGLTFFYILPFSDTHALVEYTLFSTELLPSEEYDHALQDYIANRLGVNQYQIKAVESGVIPMTDHPFPRQLGKRVLSIGTRGGRVKPTTGYAFSRIQRDTQAIVSSLERMKHPFAIPADSKRHRFYDSLMLEIFAYPDNPLKQIMTSMFIHNPVQRVFRFLDEQTCIWEDLTLLASLPSMPFLKALRNRYGRFNHCL